MRYKFFYFLFFIASILYSSFRLPLGITPRNIMSLVMLIVCLFETRHIYMDKWFGFYLIFIIFFSLSSTLTGYSTIFNHWFIGFFVVAYIGYWATTILIKKYNGYNFLLRLFVGIGLLDAFVTVGQFYNISFITQIPSLFGLSYNTEFLADLDSGDTALGIVLPGILRNDVYNGYFVMTVGILSLCFLKKGLSLLKIIPWLVFAVTSFMVQQRAPFYIFLFVSIIVFFKVTFISNNRYRYLYLIILLLLIPFLASYLFNFLMTGESRYNIGMEASNRELIIYNSIQFIKKNYLFGGFFGSHLSPHNLFLGAWICGGLFGFIAILILTVMQFGRVGNALFSKIMDERNFVRLIFGLSFVSFTLNSFFHNAGLYTGDLIIWILWGAFCPAIYTLKNTIPNKNNIFL